MSDQDNGIIQISKKYSEIFPLRAAIQAIPIVGSSIDTMLSGPGSVWMYKRLEYFIKILSEDLEKLKSENNIIKNKNILVSEEYFDFIINVLDSVIKTRNKDKLKRFSNIITLQVIEEKGWDEADSALRLLNVFTELHIKILIEAMNAPECPVPFDGKKIIALLNSYSNTEHPPVY